MKYVYSKKFVWKAFMNFGNARNRKYRLNGTEGEGIGIEFKELGCEHEK